MAIDLRNKGMVGEVGRCIYCGAHGSGVKLTKEHVIPYSLGSDAYLKDASCPDCAAITKAFEQHVARNIYGHLRIHLGIQTRHSHERPTELPVRVIKEGVESRLVLPINEHPFFLILPIWDTPGMLRGEPPQKLFTGLTSHLYYSIPPTIQTTLGVADFEPFALAPAEYRIDAEQFARAIAKIAYLCRH